MKGIFKYPRSKTGNEIQVRGHESSKVIDQASRERVTREGPRLQWDGDWGTIIRPEEKRYHLCGTTTTGKLISYVSTSLILVNKVFTNLSLTAH